MSFPTPAATAIVGIGASAGGLEALKQFFAAMPAASGLSLVVTMHLPPDRKSMLPEILAGSTSMKVLAAADGMALLPDTVYLMPADKELRVTGGRFKLQGALQPEKVSHVIDRFFGALATELAERVIAIILSGAGNDGAQGVTAVKKGGGIVIVQDPASALYADMPRSGIATGAVDMVLPVEAMPEKVIEVACRYCAAPTRMAQTVEQDEQLVAILRLVKARTGHDFSAYKTDTVLRRLQRRMVMNEVNSLARYAALLAENPEEADALHKDILIGVTSFFRDTEAFAAIKREVLPRLFEGRDPDDTVRIWHPCCATGEEVYSMAMLIQEYLSEQRLTTRAQFFATDLDDGAVALARSGLFPLSIAADIDKERLDSWFTRIGCQYQVVKQLREMIVFAHHSLIKDPPFSRLDLLVCRNFLIYLNQEMQQRLLTMFHQVLKPGGFLFLGNSETVGRHADLFAPVDKKWKIFQRQGGVMKHDAMFPLSTPVQALPGLARPYQPPRAEEPNQAAAIEKLLMERFFPTSVVVNEMFEVVYGSKMTSRFLVQQVGEPTRDIMRMIREELRPALRAAIHKAIADQQPVAFQRIKVAVDSDAMLVNIRVEPVHLAPALRLAVVVFEAVAPPLPAEPLPGGAPVGDEAAREALIRQLEEQLRITHEQLQATIEQLETSNEGFMSVNEELISTNEELQSTNEELETSKEELQTLNEELVTVNAELREKVEELDFAKSDLENLFTSSEIATIFLDRQLTIKRYSPAMAAICNIIPADIGRPFRHLAGTFDWPDLARDAREVLELLVPVEREVAPLEGGKYYLKRVLPYRTTEGEVAGIVVTLVDITARKQTEVALQRAKEEWERTFDCMPDLIAIMDDRHRIVRANRAMAERLGLTPEECAGLACYLSVHGTDRPIDTCPHALTLADGREHVAEVHEERLGGDFLVTATPFLGERGNMIGTVHVARDITERKRAEEALRASEIRYRGLFDHMLEGFAYCRMLFEEEEARDFVYLAVNSAFGKLTGLKDVIGKRVTEVIPGVRESDPELFEIYGRVASGGEPERFEMFVAALGMWFSISVYSPEQDQFVAVFDVITARKEAEQALRMKEEHYRVLFNAITDAVFVLEVFADGPPGRFLEVNDVACDRLGYARQELLRMSPIDIDAPGSGVDIEEISRRVLAGEKVIFEQTHVARDGRQILVEINAHLFMFGTKPAVLAIARDITDRRRAEEEREKAGRLESLGVLAGGIAHDFNNILTVIIGNISLARRQVGREHIADPQLAASERALAKATDLARQLLTFARGGEPVKRSVDAQRLIREVVSFALRGSNCRAELDLAPGLWRLNADEGQVHQALNNLVINALQAMPNGGTIAVAAANAPIDADNGKHLEPGDYVRITVSDQGSGIPAEIIGRVFDPYFTTKPAGTGLGLASAFSVAKRHGGTIDVSSAPGEGASFTLHLPADRHAAAETRTDDGAGPVRATATGMPILLMDDEQMIRDLVAQMLETLGYRAVTCGDGAAAVDLYQRFLARGEPFAAVILDMTVPGGMGGKEAAQRIRDIDPEAVLIISSGYSVDAGSSGETSPLFNGAAAKPYNLQQLARELTRVTNRADRFS